MRPLDTQYRFPNYSTQEEFTRLTGLACPPFNPQLPPKRWYDPEAANSNRRTLTYDPVVAYDERGFPIADADGNPLIEGISMPKTQAATVNIPMGYSNEPGADVPVIPTPLKWPLANEFEYLAFADGPMGSNIVVIKDKRDEALGPDYFRKEDRAVLFAIARALSIPVPPA